MMRWVSTVFVLFCSADDDDPLKKLTNARVGIYCYGLGTPKKLVKKNVRFAFTKIYAIAMTLIQKTYCDSFYISFYTV